MSYKPKTRFLISTGGELRELFSVREQRGGEYPTTLRININHGKFYRDGKTKIPIKNQYYSIHPSPNSPGNFIHQTIELENGTTLDSPHFSLGIPLGKFAFIMSSLPARLDIEHYKTKVRAGKDTIIKMGEFDINRGNIIWSIFVSQCGVEIRLGSNQFNVAYADFTEFRVTVLWSFIGIRPDGDGDRLHSITDSFGIKGQKSSSFPFKIKSVEGVGTATAEQQARKATIYLHSVAVSRLQLGEFERRFCQQTTTPRAAAY